MNEKKTFGQFCFLHDILLVVFYVYLMYGREERRYSKRFFVFYLPSPSIFPPPNTLESKHPNQTDFMKGEKVYEKVIYILRSLKKKSCDRARTTWA